MAAGISECDFCGATVLNSSRLYVGYKAKICATCAISCAKLHAVFSNMTITPKLEINFSTNTDKVIIYPKDIYAELCKSVIGQEHAKKVLSVALYNHYKRVTQPDDAETKIKKSNILLIGPTGTGKTLLAETLASILKVPFGTADATTYTEAGYVGDDVENIILSMVQNANYDIKAAETGIVYIDEIDKIAQKDCGRDVSGEGVQRQLLKILEGTVVTVKKEGKHSTPNEIFKIDTKNILFIVGGAFAGIDKVLESKAGIKSIGFNANVQDKADIKEVDKLRQKVCPDDLIKHGLMPEFVGRIGSIASLNSLTLDDYISILTKPVNSIISQFQELFNIDNVKLTFTNKVLLDIAEKAMKRNVGARGLRNIVEDRLLDHMFNHEELETLEIGETDVKKYRVEKEG